MHSQLCSPERNRSLLSERAAYAKIWRTTLENKYTKPNVPNKTPSLIRIYQEQASEANVHDMVTGFNKQLHITKYWIIYKYPRRIQIDGVPKYLDVTTELT